MTARITFKGKARTVYNADLSMAYRCIKVPAVTRSHCDMAAFRNHPRYGAFANSDLFPSMLARAIRDLLKGRGSIRLDQIPAGVAVDDSGFLATVTIEL